MRGQTALPALALSFLLLTAGIVITVTAAGSALESAQRPALDRQAAAALSERLVAGRASVTTRPNVLNATRVTGLTTGELREEYGLPEDTAVRVRLGDTVVVEAGNVARGVTVERLVVLEQRQSREIQPALGWQRRLPIPRRTSMVGLTLEPPPNTTVRTVQVDGRVRLQNASGLTGTFEMPISIAQQPALQFTATGPLPAGSVRVQYYPVQTEKSRLEVKVDV